MTIPDEESFLTDSEKHKPGLITVLLTLLVLLAMLTSLVCPLLQTGQRRLPTSTPTPVLLQEARMVENAFTKINKPGDQPGLFRLYPETTSHFVLQLWAALCACYLQTKLRNCFWTTPNEVEKKKGDIKPIPL